VEIPIRRKGDKTLQIKASHKSISSAVGARVCFLFVALALKSAWLLLAPVEENKRGPFMTLYRSQHNFWLTEKITWLSVAPVDDTSMIVVEMTVGCSWRQFTRKHGYLCVLRWDYY
jgi:hypothetical protein